MGNSMRNFSEILGNYVADESGLKKEVSSMQEMGSETILLQNQEPEVQMPMGSLHDAFASSDFDTVMEPTTVSEPAKESMTDVTDVPGFSLTDVSDEGRRYHHEWNPDMNILPYIGNKDLLLNYLKDLEEKFKVTMPIKACGIDSITFTAVSYLPAVEGSDNKIFSLPNSEDVAITEEGKEPTLYELISIDGALYLSCVSRCLDEEYLRSVLSEATISIKTSGRYLYPMVGLRKLALTAGQDRGSLINTLKLNTYEMSVLIYYMKEFENMNISYVKINDRQHILFEIK